MNATPSRRKKITAARKRRVYLQGKSFLVRYADDFAMGFFRGTVCIKRARAGPQECARVIDRTTSNHANYHENLG